MKYRFIIFVAFSIHPKEDAPSHVSQVVGFDCIDPTPEDFHRMGKECIATCLKLAKLPEDTITSVSCMNTLHSEILRDTAPTGHTQEEKDATELIQKFSEKLKDAGLVDEAWMNR